MGVTYFDTARGYQSGNCERMVGAALKSRRKQLTLSTKSNKEDKEGALQELETSLRELQTDYVDIWYIHAKSKASQLTDARLEAQRIAKEKGMIRFSGVSTHAGFEEIIPAAVKSGAIDVVLSAYNFTMGASIDPLLADAKKAGLGL
jgi:aryl-alcohol dehydrogenase-like predicted oxidoreductase